MLWTAPTTGIAMSPDSDRHRGAIDLRPLRLHLSSRQERILTVFDIVGKLAALAIKPDIANHAVVGGKGARRQGRVADNGLGIGVSIMGVGIDCSVVQQIAKPTFTKSITVTAKQIAAQAIDGDLQDEFDLRSLLRIGIALNTGHQQRHGHPKNATDTAHRLFLLG